MAIEFSCESCGKKLKVKDEHAGKRAKCSGCGAVNNIPRRPNDEIGHRMPSAHPAFPDSTTTVASQIGHALQSNVLRWGTLAIVVVMIAISCFVLGSLNRPVQTIHELKTAAPPLRQDPVSDPVKAQADTADQDLANESVKRQADAEARRAKILAMAAAQDSHHPLIIGTECVVFINGDERTGSSGLKESGVVAKDSLVLLIADQSNSFVFGQGPFVGMPIHSPNEGVWKAYVEAIQAFDPDGIEELIDQQTVLRLRVGTRVRVLALMPGASLLPCDDRGARVVRVTEGQAKRKTVLIPARNLRPIPDGVK
jgi:hypothetical protein